MDNYFLAHMKDLSARAFNTNKYTFSNFLNEEEINELICNKKHLIPFSLFGGTEGTQRNMVRFGDINDLYYEEDFPITCIKITPTNKKFADELSHRDFLGAIMNLSIERELIGDIIVKDSEAFVFVTDKISDFICENIKQIKRTDVKCSIAEFENGTELFELEEVSLISSSLRIDCVICAVFNLSRSVADSLMEKKKVFLNSAQCLSSSKILSADDTVSVRGFGKFIFKGKFSETRKGRNKITVLMYK